MFRKSFLALGLSLIGSPAYSQIFIPAGTSYSSLNPGPPTFGVPGLQTFTDSNGGNGFTFTQNTNCSLGNQYLSANTLNQAFTAACLEAAGTFLGQNANGSVNVGKGSAVITITNEGIQNAGTDLITKKSNGEVHIGENSLITVERNGVQELYATDANGNAIPINITKGTDLQINGTSVNTQLNNLNNRVGNLENNVNNLGSGVAGATALTAALTALPATSDDSPVSCGVGSGGYSSRYAMGFGCAARVTERLAFNAGGSYLFGGASNYGGGTLDNVAGRLGFVFKIGKITPTSTQVISKKAEQLESQLSEVKQENQKLTAYLEDMKKLIAMQNERLGNLEKVANISGSQLASQSQKPSPNFEVANSSR